MHYMCYDDVPDTSKTAGVFFAHDCYKDKLWLPDFFVCVFIFLLPSICLAGATAVCGIQRERSESHRDEGEGEWQARR
jgi:hypothetical protein